MAFFAYIAFLPLIVMFVQDIRSRSIWWFLPPVLFICLLLTSWPAIEWKELLMKLIFVNILTGFLFLYVRIRFREQGSLFHGYFGLGDYLFLLAVTPLLSFTGFIYFFTAGTIAVLLIHLTVLIIRKTDTIPYAGYFSLITVALLCTKQFFPVQFLHLTYVIG